MEAADSGFGLAVDDDRPALAVDADAGPPTKRIERPRIDRPVVGPAPDPATQGAAFVAAQRQPDRHAKVVDLATKLHLSPAFVDQNFDALSQTADQHETAYAIDHASPTLKLWLSDPDNASIGKHEIGALGRIDKGASLLATPSADAEPGPLDALGIGAATGMSDLAKSTGWFASAFGLAHPDQAAPFIADMAQRSKTLREQSPDYVKELSASLAKHGEDVDAAWRDFLAVQTQNHQTSVDIALKSFKTGAVTLGEALSLIGDAVDGTRRLKGLAYTGLESLASMAPMLTGTAIGGAVGAAVGGPFAPITGTVGAMAGTFAGVAPLNVGAEIEQELQKQGVDPTDTEQVRQALSNPQTMAMVRDKALKGGLTSAAVMSLFQGFAGQLAGAVEKAGAGKLATAAAHVGEAGIQAGGVAAAGEAGAAAEGEPTSPGRAIATTLQMLGVGAVSEGLGASRRALLHPETAQAAQQATIGANDALRAQHDALALQEVGQAVQEAQTTASVPDRLKDLIETATGGKDAATVYFQSGEWDKYWQAQGRSPAKAAADIMGDGGKNYHDAQSTGSLLAIPLSDYLTKVAPTEHFDGLIDVARTRPDGMSFGEAREYLQGLPATMQELATEATAQGQGGERPLETAAGQVRADVEDQLLKAGVGPVAAKAQAQLYESAFRTLGQRAGVSARELFNRYGLTIGRGPLEPTAEAKATIEKARAAAESVPRETKQVTEAEAAKVTSQEQFAAEREGMADERSAKAPELARPRTASGRLKNLAKATPDELANEYRLLVDANAQEVVGETTLESDRAGGRVSARAKTIAKLEAEMAKRGMDTGEAYMAAQRNAANQEPTGFQFQQATVPQQTETPEFKQWFGDSQAVDRRGRPLVVFHGSHSGHPDQFDQDEIGAGYFTSDRTIAERYARGERPTGEEGAWEPNAIDGARSRTTAVYLKIEKPITEETSLDEVLGSETEAAEYREEGVRQPFQFSASLDGLGDIEILAALAAESSTFFKYLGTQGYDGWMYPDQESGGTTYVPFHPEQVKHATDNRGTFDPNDPNMFHQGPRGRITFGDRGTSIRLLESADRSTFLHESAHLYLEVLGDLASASGAAPDLKADYATIREWVGAEGDAPLTTEQHEQFARGFEAYLMEGKAPSPDLRSAFFRFKNWLVGIYKNLVALKVDLTPDVRSVFDRMLASQDEIAEAERAGEAQPLFADARAAGMTDDQAARYEKAAADAHEAAEEQLTTEMMRSIRREESAEWKAWRDPIKEQVTREIDAQPVYQAIVQLKADDAPVKLNTGAVREILGDQSKLVTRQGITAEDGAHPDVAADLFGFASGRELVEAIAQAPKRGNAIERETDARMQAEHGTRMTDAEVSERANAAVNNAKRALLLKREAEHLASSDFAAFKGMTKAIVRKAAPDELVKAQADRIVASTKVRDIRPDLFEKATARAGKEAVDKFLSGDFQGALDAKEKQRLASAVARAARDAKDAVDASLDDFKKVFRPDSRLEKTRDLSYVNGARALLADLGIGSSDKGASAYLALIKEYAPDAYDNVTAITDDLRDLGIHDYRDLTHEQFTELATTVKQLWTLARTAKQVVIEGKAQDLEAVLQPILSEISARRSERTANRGQRKQLDLTDKLANAALSAEASLRRVDSWAREMDGLNVLGPVSRVVREVLRATNGYRTHKVELAERVAKATESLRGLPTLKDIAAPELGGYIFKDRNELLGAMLHTGNAEGATSNLVKLLVGRGWGTVDPETGMLDRSRWDAFVQRMQKNGTLTKVDYDWLQAAGDFFEALKPDLQKSYYAVNGRYMNEVTHTAFDTPFGKYQGWYYPAIGDTHVAGGAEIENAMRASEDQLLGTDGKFLLTQPQSGMTKTRTGKTWPLVMDASQLPRHLDAVLKYIHMAPPVRDVFKVFNHRDFREAMAGVNPVMVSDALIPFLRAASSQRSQAPATTALGRLFANGTSWVRQGAMQQVVGANLVILAEQVLHTSALQSMRTADNTAMVYYHDVMGAAARIMLSPQKLTRLIHEQSPTVATRDTQRLRTAEVSYQSILDPSKLRTMQEVSAHSIGFVSHVVSSLMDKAVWLGAKDRAEQRGITGQASSDYADAVVRQGLGAHHPEDLAEIQRGSALTKAMLGMYGFFNAKANQLGTDAFAKTMTDAGLKRDKMRMAVVYVTGLLALSVTGAAARDIIGGRKRKEDEPWTDVLAEWAGWGQLEAVGRFVPGGAVPIEMAKMAFHKQGASADNMLSSPSATFLSNAVGAFRAGHRVATGEQVTGKDVKDALGLFGTLFHLPIKVIARPISYQLDVQQGKTAPSSTADAIRGYLTGQHGGAR